MKRWLCLVLSLALMLCCCPTVLAAEENGFTYTVADGGACVTAYTGSATTVTVPDKLGGVPVTKIGVDAFYRTAVTDVTLPDTVTFIDECAFDSCTALKTVTLGAKLETVAFHAFYGCTALADVYYGGTKTQFSLIAVAAGNEPLTTATLHSTEPETDAISLLPDQVSDFFPVSAGGGDMTVTRLATGDYQFSSNDGWPQAITAKSTDEYVSANVNADVYLNYHFTVKTGATNIIVYFNGQSPFEATLGTWVSLNGLVNEWNVEPDGTVYDLGPGTYKGSVKVSELGYSEDMLIGNVLLLSDVKVFAVGGTTVISELSVGAPHYLPDPPPDAQYLQSLLPPSETDFTAVSAGGGDVYVSKNGNGGYWFDSWEGWPYAYTARDESDWVWADTTKEQYLYYDLTVHYGATNVVVFFGGQDPAAATIPAGSYVSLNPFIDPNLQGPNGTVYDLGMGEYRGKIPVSELGCAASLMQNGCFALSDIKVFSVGGWIEVHELALYTPPAEDAPLIGDTTGDGVLNMMDALIIYTCVSGVRGWTDAEYAVADYTKNGTVDMLDALYLYNDVSK